MIEHYRYGRIDDEGNWSEEKKQKKQSTTTTTTTTATSTATPKQTEANDGKFENPYRIVTTPPPTQPEIGINDTTSRAPSVEDPHGNIPPPAFPADPGPFTEGIRLLLFKTMPDLHPIVVNTLSAFDWTFAEYVLNNAMHPGAIIQAMTSDTLKWVTEHVANFPEILAGSDGQTVYNFFGKVPYPCQFFQSLAKSIRDQLVFKNNWLQYCEPIPVKTTAVPIHTTPQPLFNEEIIGIIRKKIPNFSLLLEIVPFEKFQSNNPKAIALFKLIQNISDEDAKKANKLFNQLTAKMTRQEAADIFLNGIREFAGSLTVRDSWRKSHSATLSSPPLTNVTGLSQPPLSPPVISSMLSKLRSKHQGGHRLSLFSNVRFESREDEKPLQFGQDVSSSDQWVPQSSAPGWNNECPNCPRQPYVWPKNCPNCPQPESQPVPLPPEFQDPCRQNFHWRRHPHAVRIQDTNCEPYGCGYYYGASYGYSWSALYTHYPGYDDDMRISSEVKREILASMPNIAYCSANQLFFVHPSFARYIIARHLDTARLLSYMDEPVLYKMLAINPGLTERIATFTAVQITSIFARTFNHCHFLDKFPSYARNVITLKVKQLEVCNPRTTITGTATGSLTKGRNKSLFSNDEITAIETKIPKFRKLIPLIPMEKAEKVKLKAKNSFNSLFILLPAHVIEKINSFLESTSNLEATSPGIIAEKVIGKSDDFYSNLVRRMFV
ncbi:unnamed protein product [Rodentolepis nana]|uniref:Integrase catalytic domain-containing protein n=1 Tax=Rodentolepis nana TaxID=102285 RepID=A0A158QJ67_RODNA|nr:unnamed protein product [Rodentolepis nana]